MSRLERLRSLVNQRMNAAAEDIGRMLEGKVSEYEEEARFFREESNSLQHKILKLASKSDVQVMVMDGDDSSSSDNQDQASTAPPVAEQEHQEETPDKPTSRRGKSQKTQDAKDSESSSSEEEEEEEDSESSDEGEDSEEGDQGEDQGARRTKRKAPQLKEEKVKRSRN